MLLRFVVAIGLLTGASGLAAEPGFAALFDGKSLDGWILVGKRGVGYGVTNGVLYCARGGGGNLFTVNEYTDFILRFEFKLDEGSNSGIGIRAPFDGDAAYVGMEIQVLDEVAAEAGKWGELRPTQYHGSIYDVVPAKPGALKPPGEWNSEEIVARGREIRVTVNGRTVLDTDINEVNDPVVLRKHPGLLRDRGHIGFLGHNDCVEFRNIRIRELPSTEKDNTPPYGFVALFNGRNLRGWKGLVADPLKRAAMSQRELAAQQKKADMLMVESWKVENGTIKYTGDDLDNLCTARDYVNFELLVDWKIEPHSDSGIYLRGCPQVQIRDPITQPAASGSEVGSGGLYNNRAHPSNPLRMADKLAGQWNRFRIVMIGNKVHVFLNGKLVVEDTTLDNYWDYGSPVPALGQIELQAHKTPVRFKNIYIREINTE